MGTILVNGEKVAEGRIDVTQFNAFSATEGADVGRGTGTPVSEDYQNPFAFNGKIERVTIDLIDDRQSAEVKAAIAKEQADTNMSRHKHETEILRLTGSALIEPTAGQSQLKWRKGQCALPRVQAVN